MIKTKISSRVLKSLSSSDASKRRAAADSLANGDVRAVYPLIQALKDPHPGVQEAAASSLISIGGEVTAWMVLPLLREEALLSNMAMVILREIGPATLRHLSPLLRDKDDDIRKFAIELVADLGGREYMDKLVERLKWDLNPNVRAVAAKALGDLRCHETLPNLVAALKDVEWVRFAVLESLCLLKDAEAVEPILELLNDPSSTTRRFAIETLGVIGSPLAGKALLSFLEKTNENERRVVLMSLLRIGIPLPGGRYSEDLFAAFLEEDGWENKIIALRGLVGIADRDALRAIFDKVGSLDATNPHDEEILRTIKEILSCCSNRKFLLDLMEDPTLRFRGKAVLTELVGELQLGEAVCILVAMLRDDARDIRRAAAYALERIGDERALEGLLDSIADHDSGVRKASVSALGALKKKEAFDPLKSLLQEEPYVDVIEEILRALYAIDPCAMSGIGDALGEQAKGVYDAFVHGGVGLSAAEKTTDDILR
ncbi:MAG: HEAT repeat domain-containing protein [Syntrophorhabdaceae bacterium]|nr:HEAT repeat domain-containing protein [Syntrophorhabdaceae bacterium]